ncbi:MAG: hypothetical protein R3281_06540 [Balneolaceae bacterium]|nr:hypothetical protein [Balneolaceae bacterium]
MDLLTNKAGRYLYGVPFAIFGLFHFLNAGAMSGMVPLPGGVFWVYLTGLALLAASVSILIEVKTRLAGILLGVMLIIFALSIHLPGAIDGSQASTSNLLKDLALAGAAWVVAGKYGEDTAGEE